MPGVATSTRSTSSAVASATRSSSPVATRFTPSRCASARTAVLRERAARAVTTSRSGCAAMTSRACCPIEPVAPRIATRVGPFIARYPSSHPTEQQDGGGHDRGGRDERIDTVQQAAVTGQQRSRILDPGAPLHPAFEQIAGECDRSDEHRGHDGPCRESYERPVPEDD